MNNLKLNAYRFSSKNGNEYIFDNIMGMVIPCSDSIFYIISNYYNFSKDQVIDTLFSKFEYNFKKSENYYNYIDSLIKRGLFYQAETKLTYQEINNEQFDKASVSQLILIVTEDCNMRCKYCIYSDNYPTIKGYSSKKMSFEVAKKSIDYYYELHKKRVENGIKKDPAVTFYGGEPFLEIDLLNNIIGYCKEKGYNFTFFVTTNGTLMNDKIINFIIENNIIVAFSLDGNKDNHDRNRLLSNDKCTHDLILQNLSKLQNEKKRRKIKYPILFSCCYDMYSDLNEIINFFKNNSDLFEPYSIIYNQINKYDTLYYDYCEELHSKGLISTSKYSLTESLKIILDQFNSKLITNQEVDSEYISLFSAAVVLGSRIKGIHSACGNACFPGSKIAASPDGEFYICEKMSQQCSIGNVETGINWSNLNKLYRNYFDIVNSNCSNCPFSRLCNLCYIHLAKDEKLEFNTQLCKDMKKSIPISLSTVFSNLESNPNAYDSILNKIRPEVFDLIK
jgi:Arylsulfatase regulator (Fe-S oxidoreductase)